MSRRKEDLQVIAVDIWVKTCWGAGIHRSAEGMGMLSLVNPTGSRGLGIPLRVSPHSEYWPLGHTVLIEVNYGILSTVHYK